MKTLEQFRTQFAPDGERVVSSALEESRRFDRCYVSVEHLLLALLQVEPEPLKLFFQHFAIDSLRVEGALSERIKYLRPYSGEGYRISPEVTDLFWRAMRRARKNQRRLINAQDILFVIAEERIDSILDGVLLTMGINELMQGASEAIMRIARINGQEKRESFISWFFSSMPEVDRMKLKTRTNLIEASIHLAWGHGLVSNNGADGTPTL